MAQTFIERPIFIGKPMSTGRLMFTVVQTFTGKPMSIQRLMFTVVRMFIGRQMLIQKRRVAEKTTDCTNKGSGSTRRDDPGKDKVRCLG